MYSVYNIHGHVCIYETIHDVTRRATCTPSGGLSGPPTVHVRNLLHSLNSNAELQIFLLGTRSHSYRTNFHQTVDSSSQNTGATSGVSSMSGGVEGDITPEEIEHLRLYIQALILQKNHYTSTLVPTEGRKRLEMVKEELGAWELVQDCLLAGHGVRSWISKMPLMSRNSVKSEKRRLN